MKLLNIIFPPNSFTIISFEVGIIGLAEGIDFFTGLITPHKKEIFYTLIVLFIIAFFINMFVQYKRKIDNLITDNEELQSQVAKVQNTNSNLTELYNDAKKENQRYADEQNQLKEESQNKDATFTYFIYQLIDIDTPDPRTIELLHQMAVLPNSDRELINAGIYALEHKLQARKDIDAIEATEESKNV